jgi:hypothetical protein
MIRPKGSQNPRYFRGLLEALRDGRIVASSRPSGTEGPPNHAAIDVSAEARSRRYRAGAVARTTAGAHSMRLRPERVGVCRR